MLYLGIELNNTLYCVRGVANFTLHLTSPWLLRPCHHWPMDWGSVYTSVETLEKYVLSIGGKGFRTQRIDPLSGMT